MPSPLSAPPQSHHITLFIVTPNTRRATSPNPILTFPELSAHTSVSSAVSALEQYLTTLPSWMVPTDIHASREAERIARIEEYKTNPSSAQGKNPYRKTKEDQARDKARGIKRRNPDIKNEPSSSTNAPPAKKPKGRNAPTSTTTNPKTNTKTKIKVEDENEDDDTNTTSVLNPNPRAIKPVAKQEKQKDEVYHPPGDIKHYTIQHQQNGYNLHDSDIRIIHTRLYTSAPAILSPNTPRPFYRLPARRGGFAGQNAYKPYNSSSTNDSIRKKVHILYKFEPRHFDFPNPPRSVSGYGTRVPDKEKEVRDWVVILGVYEDGDMADEWEVLFGGEKEGVKRIGAEVVG